MHNQLKSKKILLIERDNTLHGSLTELLSLQGYEILEAKNGYSGLRYAKAYLPDLIICSRLFSDINAWEVLQALKKEEITKGIQFIFLSSKPAGKIHQKMIKAAQLIVIVKPFDISRFLAVVQDSLSDVTT